MWMMLAETTELLIYRAYISLSCLLSHPAAQTIAVGKSDLWQETTPSIPVAVSCAAGSDTLSVSSAEAHRDVNHFSPVVVEALPDLIVMRRACIDPALHFA